MREKFNVQSCFTFVLSKSLKIVKDYQEKYNRIDRILQENPRILNTVHKDFLCLGVESGRKADFTSEQMLRMILVKGIEKRPFRKIVIDVDQSHFLRNFIKVGVGKMMDPSFLCKANKCLNASTWARVNKLLLQAGIEDKNISEEKVRVDSTVREANIHYPTDSSLLWDSYRVLSRLIRKSNELEPAYNLGNRFHDKKIKKMSTYIATHCHKKNNSTRRKIKRYYRKLLERTLCLIETSVFYARHARKLNRYSPADYYVDELEHYIPLAGKVADQTQRRVMQGISVPNNEKIFSIFEPHTELLKRGKAGKPMEWGHMVTIAQTAEKFISYYDVRDISKPDKEYTDVVLENHKKQFGCYPTDFTADKNYHKSKEHTQEWELEIDNFSVGKKGNRNQEEINREHTDKFREAQRFRAGSEGSISVLKRVFGLDKCFLKGYKSFAASVGSIVCCHNLVLLARL